MRVLNLVHLVRKRSRKKGYILINFLFLPLGKKRKKKVFEKLSESWVAARRLSPGVTLARRPSQGKEQKS